MLSEERATEILLEETLSRRVRTQDTTAEETSYRLAVRDDVARIKDAGLVVVIPTTQPDMTQTG